MPRRAVGEVLTYRHADGLITFSARFRANGRRYKLKLGTDAEGWNGTRARNEVDAIVDRVRRGVWSPPDASRSARREDPTFHEFASAWLARKRHGLRPRTVEDYEWRLSNHLLPFFRAARLSEIDVRLVDAYREAKLVERDELRAAGKRSLSNDSINATIALLAQILDEAIEHRFVLEGPNPAKGRRRRLEGRRGRRSFLEPDQAAALLEAARELDARSGPLDWASVREIRSSTESNVALGIRYGVSDSLISRIRRGAAWSAGRVDARHRPIVATLILAGPRIQELCALNVGDIDLVNKRLHIEDAKTVAGIRPIVLSDLLADELVAHIARLGPAPADAPLFPNARGRRYTPSGIRSSVLPGIVAHASKRLAAHGGRMPSSVTPHTLRRTFISLLLAGGADVPWVMAQVGHVDPKVTLQIYAQVVQGKRRDYGARVDGMIRGATSFGSNNGATHSHGEGSTIDSALRHPAHAQ